MERKEIVRQYHHHLLTGSPYAIGQQQGQLIKSAPGLAQYFVNPPGMVERANTDAGLSLIKEYAPSLLEELQGMADALEVDLSHLVYISESYLPGGACTQFIAPGAGKFYHVRNYEFSADRDDLRLVTTAVDGAYRHIGFSVLFCGRYEGINEMGLTITMNASGIPVGVHEGMSKPSNAGLQFWVLLRMVLDHCKNVDEALAMMADFPLASNTNFLLSDAEGKLALMEANGKTHAVKRFAQPEVVVSTNHFSLPEMQGCLPRVLNCSFTRYEKLQAYLDEAKGTHTQQSLKDFLLLTYPEGINFHHYSEFFGTLRSMIFHPQEKAVEICFGMPGENEWHLFNVAGGVPRPIFPVVFNDEKAPPEFWQMRAG